MLRKVLSGFLGRRKDVPLPEGQAPANPAPDTSPPPPQAEPAQPRIGKSDAEFGPTDGAYFPLSYLTDMCAFIEQHADRLKVITYEDLDLRSGANHASNYLPEYQAWKAAVAQDPEARSKAHLLIQYDIDRFPDRMQRLISHPSHQAVPANIMLFHERVDRWRLQSSGELHLTSYDVDQALLRQKQEQGFVIGYHTNAYELSGFDTARALELFDRDMSALHKAYGARFFSAHGGVPGPDGLNNNGLPYHPGWVDRAVWVHNGVNVRFDGVYSDGGHNSPKRDPATRDLRRFFETLQPGKRYRILLHPQYYSPEFQRSKRYSGTPWYDALLDADTAATGESSWRDVALGFTADP